MGGIPSQNTFPALPLPPPRDRGEGGSGRVGPGVRGKVVGFKVFRGRGLG